MSTPTNPESTETVKEEAVTTLPSLSLQEYAVRMVSPRLIRMASHAEGVREGETIEPIHQMRVWSRRTRAALDIFAPCFAPKPFMALAQEVKQVTRALGTARDLDVMILRLRKLAETLPESQRAGVYLAVGHLVRAREEAQPAVTKTMQRFLTFDLTSRWKSLAVLPPPSKVRPSSLLHPDRSLLQNASHAIRERMQAFLAYEACLEQPDMVHELHAMRIAGKRLRYTIEIFKEAFEGQSEGGYVKEFHQHIRTIQDILGEIHDADVIVPTLTEQLSRIIGEGFGKDAQGEDLVGVHRIDYNVVEGLFVLCRRIATERDAHFTALQQVWGEVRTSGILERLDERLHAIEEIGEPATS